MKLFRLLQMDRGCQNKVGLPRSFGDSYLVENNMVFKNIRLAAVESGFSFSHNPEPAYISFPLGQLENIMATRQIPYVDNVGVLLSMEKKCPREIDFFEIGGNLKKNFVFHESCHAVVRQQAGIAERKPSKLELLVEESFANTCELFGMLEAESPAHRIFYDMNSYTALFEIRTNLKTTCAEIGPTVLFQFFFLGYLHSNFLFSSYSDKEYGSIVSFLSASNDRQFTPQQLKSIRALIKICFTLDLEFRTITTNLHLKLNGQSEFTATSCDFAYFEKLVQNPVFGQNFKKLAALALHECRY